MTPFEGLCGFRPLTEIQKYLNTVPEIAEVIGQDAANAIASGSGLWKLVLGSRDGAVVRVPGGVLPYAYRLYRYMPRKRVWFLRFLVLE